MANLKARPISRHIQEKFRSHHFQGPNGGPKTGQILASRVGYFFSSNGNADLQKCSPLDLVLGNIIFLTISFQGAAQIWDNGPIYSRVMFLVFSESRGAPLR